MALASNGFIWMRKTHKLWIMNEKTEQGGVHCQFLFDLLPDIVKNQRRWRAILASAHPLYYYTSSHQTQLDSCRWHLVWRVWRLIEDVFDAGGIKSNTFAFQTWVLLFEVWGQHREVQVCSDQLLLTFREGKRAIQQHVEAKPESKTLPGNSLKKQPKKTMGLKKYFHESKRGVLI